MSEDVKQPSDSGSVALHCCVATLPHAYKLGNNPCCDESEYSCDHCGLQLHGDDIGYVGAGWTCGADREWSKCPQCGEEIQFIVASRISHITPAISGPENNQKGKP